jgi:hypothetical protein
MAESVPRGMRLRAGLIIRDGDLIAIPEHAAATATRYLSVS